MKIVLLTARYGNGHVIVANNIKKEFESANDIVIINPHKEYNRFIYKIVEWTYLNMLSKKAQNNLIKKTYGFFFEIFGNKQPLLLSLYGRKQIRKIVKEENPDLLIMTFPFGTGKLPVKTLTTVTDFGFSKVWYSKNTDYYVVTSENVKNDLSKLVDQEKIYTTGIPVKKLINQENEKTHVTEILLTLGADGKIKYDDVKYQIDAVVTLNLTINIVCGKNQEIYQKLVADYNTNKQVKIYGYVNNMEDLYKRSDLVISKAGGVTLAESIAAEVPVIINETLSLIGQEQYNIDFVNESGIGLCVPKDKIHIALNEFISDESTYLNAVNQLKSLKNINNEERSRLIKNIIEEINE